MTKIDFEPKIINSILLKYENALFDLQSANSTNLSSFCEKTITNFQSKMLKEFNDYDVLRGLIISETKKTSNLLKFIEFVYLKDKKALIDQRLVSINFTTFLDVNLNAGDFHNGHSTTIITIDNNKKLVFKPTDGNITNAFHHLLSWVNIFYDLGRYGFEILNRGNYHWLEFVTQKPIVKKKQLQEYYKRSGYITFITYVLNSSDYHFENVICNGDLPVLIDHETIIQPLYDKRIQTFFKTFDNASFIDTVLCSALLPNTLNKGNTGISTGVCGLGWHKEQNVTNVKKVSVNRFTSDWKIIDKFVSKDLFEHNIPEFNGERVYLREYVADFMEGFESCYKLFLSQRNFLSNDGYSPIALLANCKIRYIWRPTSVYVRVLEAVRQPKNLKSKVVYEQKISDYLAVAFKNVPKDSDLWLIHKHEVAQILRGDIPYFEVNSSSRDLHTEFGTIKEFFELSAVENIQRKLKKISLEDLEFQKNLIIESIT